MADQEYNFAGIPDAPPGGYNFAGIEDAKSDTSPQSPTMAERVKGAVKRNALPIAATAAAAAPLVTRATEAFATSPTAAKTGGALARAGTTIAGIVHGVTTGNIPEIVASPLAGWQAGKGGYWLTRHAQSVAAPIAKALDAAAPIIGAASNALNVGTIAQAEADVTRRGEQYFNDPQVQLKMVQQLIAKGASPSDAVKRVTGGVPQLMGPLMGLYMRSKGPQ